jgi:signal transduction histidine kinase
MHDDPGENRGANHAKEQAAIVLWMSGAWVLPLLAAAIWLLPATMGVRATAAILALLLAPVPALLYQRSQRTSLLARAAEAEEAAEQLKLQLETVRYRTSRLREELQAADRQARLSHQLTLLGQFTAGFMHEFNNPLAIVVGRLEVLLEERKEDAALCDDLEQMLKEARYMGNIAGTLLKALRRERGGEVFEASAPQKAVEDAVAAFHPAAKAQGVQVIEEYAEAPRVDVPEHVVGEVVRGLISNALEALKGREDATIWARIEPYRTAGARVLIRVEDNGPGVPEELTHHLFEPFVSQSSGRERLGLGLFLAASLLDMYDGQIRYEMRYGGGSSFMIELPPARFTRGQPYHWFAGGASE